MAWQYYFLDNGRYQRVSNRKEPVFFPARVMHHCNTLYEAIEKAKAITYGKPIEIYPRYGGFPPPTAIVEPDGRIHNSRNEPIYHPNN